MIVGGSAFLPVVMIQSVLHYIYKLRIHIAFMNNTYAINVLWMNVNDIPDVIIFEDDVGNDSLV